MFNEVVLGLLTCIECVLGVLLVQSVLSVQKGVAKLPEICIKLCLFGYLVWLYWLCVQVVSYYTGLSPFIAMVLLILLLSRAEIGGHVLGLLPEWAKQPVSMMLSGATFAHQYFVMHWTANEVAVFLAVPYLLYLMERRVTLALRTPIDPDLV